MKKIWFTIVILSLVFMCFTTPENAVNSMMDSGKTAVELCLKLVGIYAIWLGILQIVEDSGVSTILANLVSPVIDLLFGKISLNAKKYIATNLSANILGMGNACTPTGIMAMRELDKENNSIVASRAMIMLIVLNATSIQLLPTTIIGLRTVHNSINASDIIIPTLISTVISTLVGVLLVSLFSKMKHKKRKIWVQVPLLFPFY